MTEVAQLDYPSLVESYSECINSFSRLVAAFTEPTCEVVCRGEVQLPQILEEYGKTKIWGDQSKVDLPAGARGSLDDTLRHNNDLKSLVRDILQRLRVLLQQATYIAQRKCDHELEADQESISSVSDSDYSTDDDNNETQNRRMPKICLIVQQISEQVKSLHEVSSLLRRPTITNKFIRSTNAEWINTTTPENPDIIHVNDAFRLFDGSHILEKVLQWRGLSKSTQGMDFLEENAASLSDAPDCPEVKDIQWLCQRLARANTRRREQLRYWKDHPYNSTQTFTGIDSVVSFSVEQRGTMPLEGPKGDLRSQGPAIKPDNNEALREGPKSVFSTSNFSAAAFSDVHDAKTNVRPRTVYAPTAMGRDRAVAVPNPPRRKDTDSFTDFPCPYCGMTLESKDRVRQFWKRHVYRDLRPYSCTFRQCDNAEKLFSSRHEWKHHEFQVHRREYRCQICHRRCRHRKEMLTHLQGHYDNSIPLSQIDILLDLCNCQVDPSNETTEPCILCEEEVPLSTWHDHVGAHMETLSLFVLSFPETEDEIENSVNSGDANALGSDNGDTGTGSGSPASSLGFSATEGQWQTPADFDQLVGGGTVGYVDKISGWKAAEEATEEAAAKGGGKEVGLFSALEMPERPYTLAEGPRILGEPAPKKEPTIRRPFFNGPVSRIPLMPRMAWQMVQDGTSDNPARDEGNKS